MAPERESLRFYVDESALGIGKTLAAARKDTIHVGHELIPECPYGVRDTDWIPEVARRLSSCHAKIEPAREREQPGRVQRRRGAATLWPLPDRPRL